METLPSKEEMRKFGTFNKMSKIYSPFKRSFIFEKQNYKRVFNTIDEAMDYFFTKEALDSYKYCHRFEKKLVNNFSLHWTIDFGVPADPEEKPWADCWRDIKADLTARNGWFKNPTKIKHDPPHLF
jgi:hypothetical protein